MVTHRRQSGFTLMEGAISLAVLSICATAVVATGGPNLRHFARSHEETLAGRAAASQIELVTSAPGAPAVGTTGFRTAQRFGGGVDATWGAGVQTVTRVEPGLYRVEVAVSWNAADGGIATARLATLVARDEPR